MKKVASETTTSHNFTPEETRRSEARADFMKRFFSVAVSVGFASKIGEFSFLSSFALPNEEQMHQLVLLVFAMTVVVGSWEFYFRSINRRPLIDVHRFVVDIIIVSLYIVLLLSVRVFDTFLFYVDIVMFLYIVWDVLSMRAFPQQYGIPSFSFSNVLSVYGAGMCNWKGIDESKRIGPFITLWWFLIFLLLLGFHRKYQAEFYNVAVGSALAYILYRVDQVHHHPTVRRLAESVGVFLFLFCVHVLYAYIADAGLRDAASN